MLLVPIILIAAVVGMAIWAGVTAARWLVRGG